MKIAVIGGGIFGVTSAIELAKKGHTVDLFEKNPDILMAASGINQYRFHRGYHYPRSSETITSSLRSEPLFTREYASAILSTSLHYYCIAKEGSKTSAKDFLAMCELYGLEHEEALLPCVDQDTLSLCVKVKESLINPLALKELCKERLAEHKVHLHLGKAVDSSIIDSYDKVVLSAYAGQNSLLEGTYADLRKEYQFEVCEKPLLQLPASFKDKSIVIMDGPFMCIDPYAETGQHVMGNVVHAIHATNIGFFPEIPEHIAPLLNKGIIKDPPVTNIDLFLQSAAFFMPEIKDARHIGSMYTIRTVLPYKDKTDTRPTLVEKISDKIITVFSGKISTCVEAAHTVVECVEK